MKSHFRTVFLLSHVDECLDPIYRNKAIIYFRCQVSINHILIPNLLIPMSNQASIEHFFGSIQKINVENFARRKTANKVAKKMKRCCMATVFH
jgi:hypothetical protein